MYTYYIRTTLMSQVTSSQQELIDEFISSYIKNNDNIGRQYLKLRQSALEVTTKINEEIKANGATSDESLIQLQQLEFENDKLSETYRQYLSRIGNALDYADNVNPRYLNSLEDKFLDLSSVKEKVEADIEDFRQVKKPIVDKMNSLADRYSQGITVTNKSTQRGKRTYILTGRGSNPDPNSTFIDFSSTVFNKTELRSLFDDTEKKLQNIKTVDEVGESKNEQENLDVSANTLHAINIEKYLDELLQDSRAFSRAGEEEYAYDISKSTSIDVGGSGLVLDDYNRNIDKLTTEIQNLVAGGAAAKERWIINARRLEMVQAVLENDGGADIDLDV